jgi:hypothetical protein
MRGSRVLVGLSSIPIVLIALDGEGKRRVFQSPHMLVVDDDLEIRKLLGRYLSAQEFRVTLASDKAVDRCTSFLDFYTHSG